MKSVRVRNWNELNDRLFENTWYRAHGRFRGPFVFRGMSNETWDLSTSLMRLAGQFDKVESSLLRNFRKYGRRSTDHGDTFWHWMVVAQHHGLPTRLLDWTYSPHIAAHFATENVDDLHRDGVIWAVDMIGVHERLPKNLRKLLKDEQAFLFTTPMLDTYAKSLAEFDRRLGKSRTRGALFIEPPSLDDRIVNQAAVLSIMVPAHARLDEWLANDLPDLYRRIVIPASVKLEIRDKLDMLNITERLIYPGLDGLSRWLRRYYSPLNIMEIAYPGQDRERVGVTLRIEDGVMHVRLFRADGRNEGEARIESRDDGQWYDVEKNCRIAIRRCPSGDLSEPIRAFLRSLKTPPA
ncbi:MAG: FRG domain-containing protein [Acidobacteriota bacterium]|nr:FRG domain-containing protein [Acidobacteriota bacterium]